MFDYAWNPYYDSWNVPSITLPNSRLSPAAIDVTSTPSSDAASLAQQTVDGGYGVFMTYNLGASDIHDYISSFTDVLYGSDAVYNG